MPKDCAKKSRPLLRLLYPHFSRKRSLFRTARPFTKRKMACKNSKYAPYQKYDMTGLTARPRNVNSERACNSVHKDIDGMVLALKGGHQSVDSDAGQVEWRIPVLCPGMSVRM